MKKELSFGQWAGLLAIFSALSGVLFTILTEDIKALGIGFAITIAIGAVVVVVCEP